ncbi:MAG: cyclic nucleotide-binding domain-containing protein [Methylobacter sp.]|nr:cyclic nucleotide-binding domain-containing protein [Methylobacter sp.]
MTVDLSSEDAAVIRKLIPLTALPVAQFSALCAQMAVQEIDGGILFEKGDTDSYLVYLIKGEVILQAEGLIVEIINAESESARFALAHQIPRKIDAVAKGVVRFLRLDADSVNNPPPLCYKEDNTYMVTEEPEADQDDWMTALLKLPVFQSLPPANLQKILISMEMISFSKDEIIVEQGSAGDYFYLIKSGECLLTRKPSPNAKEIKLAQLRNGDTFGEDSLISDAPRNLTITALTDISLLRLGKKQFLSLIKEPSLKFVNYAEMQEALKQGATILDVRSPDEYKIRHLNCSINAPFFSLRMQLKTLNRETPLIVVCANGKVSEAAAFLLLKHKFNAMILKKGMEGIEPDPNNETAHFNIDDGIETLIDPGESVHRENHPEAGDKPISTAGSDREDRIRFLKSENENLRKTNHQLTDKCKRLELEKEHTEKQYRILFKQMEKLTQVLDRLKGS